MIRQAGTLAQHVPQGTWRYVGPVKECEAYEEAIGREELAMRPLLPLNLVADSLQQAQYLAGLECRELRRRNVHGGETSDGTTWR